jgi:hypothetical protein
MTMPPQVETFTIAAVGLHGSQDPAYDDTIYVVELVAPDVVNRPCSTISTTLASPTTR